MQGPIRLYDRSRTTTDWSCKFKRYLQYEYQGKGIVSGNTSLELYMGSCIHDGLAAIATATHEKRETDIDQIATMAQKQMVEALLAQAAGESQDEAFDFANEQAALVEGLLRGFYRHAWPRLLTDYPEIVVIEQEMEYLHGGGAYLFMARPDLVLRDREGNLWYIEYKSTSSKKDTWVNSWATAVQVHSTVRAIEATINEKITGVIVQGLYKGYESYGKQNSPFCYAYKRNGNPPFTHDETLYEYKAGFKRTPTWEMADGVRGWVANMPDTILADQFPQTPPIFIKDQMIDEFFREREFRENEIGLALQMLEVADEESAKEILHVAFPKTYSECVPAWGKPCTYRRICHGQVENPLVEGFVLREPHHALELRVQQEGADAVFGVPEETGAVSSGDVAP